MKVKLGKRKSGQHIKLPGHCSKCVFRRNSLEFCVLRIRCTVFGYFHNRTSEDIFKL